MILKMDDPLLAARHGRQGLAPEQPVASEADLLVPLRPLSQEYFLEQPSQDWVVRLPTGPEADLLARRLLPARERFPE